MDRHALRRRWREGAIEKTAFAHEMRALHYDLEEYVELIRDTRVASITITDEGIVIASRWGGVRFHADLSDIGTPVSVSLSFGDYEPEEMAMLLSLLSEARVFVDVGANIGWYCAHAAVHFPALRVLAVEPVASTFGQLSRNLALNEVSVEALQIGLSDQPGTAQMQVPEGIAGASSLQLSRPYPGQRTEHVELRTLDELAIAQELFLDVLKIDVEGAELLVLRGGTEVLKRDRPAVLAEMLRIHARPFGYHPNDIIAFLGDLGYRCLTFRDGAWRRFVSMDESTVETNFLFLHEQRHAERLGHLAD